MSETIRERWSNVQMRVHAACKRVGRDSNSVRVVAVSKAIPQDKIAEAYRAGGRIFGENYAQEALSKLDHFHSKPEFPKMEWHFIGNLQSNKAKQVAGKFSLIHSLDRMSLAKELDKHAKKQPLPIRALIEVNIGEEKSKSGVRPSDVQSFVEKISRETELHILGLMSFPPPSDNPETSRAFFRKTRELAVELSGHGFPRISMNELSMGVTSDFEVAIEEGATLVRIGTAIFGPRAATHQPSLGTRANLG